MAVKRKGPKFYPFQIKGARKTHTVVGKSPTASAMKNSNKATARGVPGNYSHNSVATQYDDKLMSKRLGNPSPKFKRRPRKKK